MLVLAVGGLEPGQDDLVDDKARSFRRGLVATSPHRASPNFVSNYRSYEPVVWNSDGMGRM